MKYPKNKTSAEQYFSKNNKKSCNKHTRCDGMRDNARSQKQKDDKSKTNNKKTRMQRCTLDAMVEDQARSQLQIRTLITVKKKEKK